MKLIITGSTGFVGKGVLLECLKDERISTILVINREPLGIHNPKLKEIIHSNFFDLSPIKNSLAGYEACFFCLGTTSFLKTEQEYTKITYDLTMNVARTLLECNENMTFCYVSGAGTDSSEGGRTMWARVKGKTENELLKMGFKAAFMFRPGYIQPVGDIKSKTLLYDGLITLIKPLYPLIKTLFPKTTTTSENVGRAMIKVAFDGHGKPHLESSDINELAF